MIYSGLILFRHFQDFRLSHLDFYIDFRHLDLFKDAKAVFFRHGKVQSV